MGIIVQKYGGSSVADTEKIFNVCLHIIEEVKKENKVIVVVSAQGKTTDNLVKQAKEISEDLNKREFDVLASVGEQITISKLSMALNKLGYKSKSLTGWQIPIITDSNYTNAKIKSINSEKILKELDDGNILVIAGFQGVTKDGDITTLGRGGSDTTAVAIASAVKADRCDIFTDVDGVYTVDPRIIKNSKKIESISYDEMLELASLGAKVLHNRCVEIGKKYNEPIYVKSSFERDSRGTKVVNKSDIEDINIQGIAKEENIIKIDINIEEKDIYVILSEFTKNNINIDMLEMSKGKVSFTLKKSDFDIGKKILEEAKITFNYIENLTKISVVGSGLKYNLEFLPKLFKIFADTKTEIYQITTSEIKISFLIKQIEADDFIGNYLTNLCGLC